MAIQDTLDTSKLQPGMTVKNYKELCNLLNEPIINGGCSRRAQLYNWTRFFKYEKQPHKDSYLIQEVYEAPIKEKRKQGRKPTYRGKSQD